MLRHTNIARYIIPSAYTASSFAVAVVLYKNVPHTYGIAVLFMAAMIGFSRIYVGVHYPSDVVCGAVSGSIIGKLAVSMLIF